MRACSAGARRLSVPIAVVMAGGYGRDIDVTVDAHFNTVLAAYRHWRACAATPMRWLSSLTQKKRPAGG